MLFPLLYNYIETLIEIFFGGREIAIWLCRDMEHVGLLLRDAPLLFNNVYSM